MHHLTIIAWERYVAIQKWMDYKLIITNGRIKKIAIGAWLSVIFPTVAYFTMKVVVVDRRILSRIITGWIAVETICLFLVIFFYRKVYLGVRSRELNKISQINALIKGKLEYKVAKTTALLTAAFICAFIPIFVFAILGNAVPVIRTNTVFQFTQTVAQMNSLFNPLLYCYRDQRFRTATRELLGLKKPQGILSAVGAAHLFRRKDLIRSLELPKVGKRSHGLTRSASCNLTEALDSIRRTPSDVMLKKSLSAPTLDNCSSSLDGLDLQRSLPILEAGGTTHVEGGV